MSSKNINKLCAIHDDFLQDYHDVGPFASIQHMLETIDSIQHGDAPWMCLKASVPYEDENVPSWKKKAYDIWYRDPDIVLQQMLQNQDFHGEFNYALYVELDSNGERVWSNIMSGNYAWWQSVSSKPVMTWHSHTDYIEDKNLCEQSLNSWGDVLSTNMWY